jgi:hypothetical protein
VENLKVRNYFESLGVDGRIILTWILKKWGVKWTGLKWLRMGFSDGFL